MVTPGDLVYVVRETQRGVRPVATPARAVVVSASTRGVLVRFEDGEVRYFSHEEGERLLRPSQASGIGAPARGSDVSPQSPPIVEDDSSSEPPPTIRDGAPEDGPPTPRVNDSVIAVPNAPRGGHGPPQSGTVKPIATATQSASAPSRTVTRTQSTRPHGSAVRALDAGCSFESGGSAPAERKPLGWYVRLVVAGSMGLGGPRFALSQIDLGRDEQDIADALARDAGTFAHLKVEEGVRWGALVLYDFARSASRSEQRPLHRRRLSPAHLHAITLGARLWKDRGVPRIDGVLAAFTSDRLVPRLDSVVAGILHVEVGHLPRERDDAGVAGGDARLCEVSGAEAVQGPAHRRHR